LVGCALLLSGWHMELGIYCLMAFTIAANGIYNRFWNMADPMKRDFAGFLFGANTGVLGGLLLLL
jgi:uncharacterized membrane protein YphA (DoxX/SURF4 family)